MKKLREIWDQWMITWRFTNRNVAKATILYWYIIIGGGAGILYAIIAAIAGWPMWYAFIQLILLLGYITALLIKRNWTLFWIYLRDIDQGRLLMRLNDRTHFQDSHKLRLIQWVYPRRNQVRNETWVKIGNKIKNGELISDQEKKDYKKKVVGCPQQLIDGINEAILIDSLIYAHRNIRTLDPEIREIMKMTDENILAFNLDAEINKCRTKESREKIEKLLNIGEQISKSKKK